MSNLENRVRRIEGQVDTTPAGEIIEMPVNGHVWRMTKKQCADFIQWLRDRETQFPRESRHEFAGQKT